MARAPDVIVDDSPLDAPRIDVALRVGWLLRTCRLNSPLTKDLPGHRFASEMGVGAAMVTKWEKGTDPIDARDVAAYEAMVGMPAGSLRGLIETTRRTFRHATSPEVAAAPLPTDLESITETVRPAMHGEPTGEDWLHLADALGESGALRLPLFTAKPVIDRLAGELARSVGAAFLSRYEAMARLRCGPYGDVALRSILDFALAEDCQLSMDLLRIAGHRPSPELFVEMTRLLLDPREGVFFGAGHAVIAMAVQGMPKAALRDAVPHLVRAYNALCDVPERHCHMSELFRNLPPGVLETAREDLKRPLALPSAHLRAQTKQSELYRSTQALADGIRAELPYPTDQVLERLLFEALFDGRWAHRTTAALFLKAVPYRAIVSDHVARFAEQADTEDVHGCALRLLTRFGDRGARPTVERWLTDGSDAELATALANLGLWGTDVDEAVLAKAIDRHAGRLEGFSLYAAGMSGSPVLLSWAEDPAKSDRVRATARWWLHQGARVEV